ncbi:MAG: hypothetical protein OK454_00710 [Thaumarchaeota archaeon]|nr:hypothetical protein [Nitrososphaerota archaeon]MDA4136306.1 hypothetical protein [Nitrososphaerota archaeon]
MSAPKVRSGRLARAAMLLMIVLGVFSILVSVAVAAILIVLGAAMYLFEWWLVRKVRRSSAATD